MTAKLVRLLIGSISLGIALVLSVVAVLVWLPSEPEAGESADFATAVEVEPWGIDGGFEEFSFHEVAWIDMNRAMQTDDRELFLSYASGDAADQLALWWDNTKAIGWDVGYIEPYEDDDGTQTALVGVDLAFPATPLRGNGKGDAGLNLAISAAYAIETTGEGDDLTVTSFTPAHAPAPWDEGPIYVQKRDHVVLFGLETEKAVVDANIEAAEQGAELALDTARQLDAEVPQEGFLAAITHDMRLFDVWYSNADEADARIPAAFAQPTVRPQFTSDLVDASIATGFENSGGYAVMGPGSEDYLVPSFVHEFGHILHFTAAPDSGMWSSPSTIEGFARYMEIASGATDRTLVSNAVKAYVAEHGTGALSAERFTSTDAPLAYDAAGSYFQFVAERGGDPWLLAVDAKFSFNPIDIEANSMDRAFTGDNWVAWVAAQ